MCVYIYICTLFYLQFKISKFIIFPTYIYFFIKKVQVRQMEIIQFL